MKTASITELHVPAPGRFEFAADRERDLAESEWWKDLGGAGLDRLLASALRGNRDLRAAAWRVQAARAAAGVAAAGRAPRVDLNSGQSVQRSETGGRGGMATRRYETAERYTLGLGLQWELDLFGRLEAAESAARFEIMAGERDLEALELLIAGEVALAWLAGAFSNAEEKLLDRQVEAASRQASVLATRTQFGSVDVAAVLIQRSTADRLRARREEVRLARYSARYRLSALQGKVSLPSEAELEYQLPSKLQPLDVRDPHTVIRNRPDVQAAMARVRVADAEVAVAIADRWPRFQLDLTAGFDSQRLSKLLLDDVLAGALNATLPLFDGGAKSHAISERRALAKAAGEDLVGVAVQACREIQEALVEEQQRTLSLDEIDRALSQAEVSWEAARSRVAASDGDALQAFVALETLHALERLRMAERLALCQARVKLGLALARPLPRTLGADTPEVPH